MSLVPGLHLIDLLNAYIGVSGKGWERMIHEIPRAERPMLAFSSTSRLSTYS